MHRFLTCHCCRRGVLGGPCPVVAAQPCVVEPRHQPPGSPIHGRRKGSRGALPLCTPRWVARAKRSLPMTREQCQHPANVLCPFAAPYGHGVPCPSNRRLVSPCGGPLQPVHYGHADALLLGPLDDDLVDGQFVQFAQHGEDLPGVLLEFLAA